MFKNIQYERNIMTKGLKKRKSTERIFWIEKISVSLLGVRVIKTVGNYSLANRPEGTCFGDVWKNEN